MSGCRLVLGTAGLTDPYGLLRARSAMPSPDASERLLRAATSADIVAFDAAPGYGRAERVLGDVLGGSAPIWTKVVADNVESALASARSSVVFTRREPLDLLQWHNWDAATGETTAFKEAWRALANSGLARRFGATTYGSEAAVAAARSGLFDCVQVEWNLLNQSALRGVLNVAASEGVEIAVRSVLLQGVLADADLPLPSSLIRLSAARNRVVEVARRHGMLLREFALRAALSQEGVGYVVLGAQTQAEFEDLLSIVAMGPLGPEVSEEAQTLDAGAITEVDPRTWR